MPRISERRAPVTAAEDRHLPDGAPGGHQQGPELGRFRPVELSPLDSGALDRDDLVRGDQPVRYRLAERGAEHASAWAIVAAAAPLLLHPREDRSNVAGA
jgi:hypothetical protein